MRRVWSSGVIVVASVLTSAVASAKPAASGLALGIERGFGFFYNSESQELAGTETTTTESGFSLGIASGAGLFSVSRLGVDYILPFGLSFGSGIGVGFKGSNSQVEDEDEMDGTTWTYVVLAPRVGFSMAFSDVVGLWPRWGVSYASLKTDDEDFDFHYSSSDVALTFDLPLTLMPASSWGLMLGPTFDLGLAHTEHSDLPSADAETSFFEFGFRVGVFGVL